MNNPKIANVGSNWVLNPNHTIDAIEEEFDLSAPAYEQSSFDWDYRGADDGAAFFARLVSPHSRVVDAGCGSGLVGQRLGELGFGDLTGCDISSAMLALAREKNIYSGGLYKTDIQALPLEANAYGALVCIAVFSAYTGMNLKGNAMPLAIVFTDNDIMPSIWSEDTDEILLQRLNRIIFAPELTDVNSAREWLALLPEPSGWFATTQEAANYTARLKQEKRATAEDVTQAREKLGLSRADLAEAIGIGGHSNTRHKTIYDIEKGKFLLSSGASRSLRAVLTARELE